MAAIPVVNTFKSGAGAKIFTPLTATASDTFAYKPGVNQALVVFNDTAGALTPNLDGGGTSFPSEKLGNVNTTGGITTASIPVNETAIIPLDPWAGYLSDATTVTGADTAKIWIIED